MKPTPEKTPRDNLLDTADGVSRGLRACFSHVATGGEADSVIHHLAVAGAMIFELCEELRRPVSRAIEFAIDVDAVRDAAPVPAPGAKCRHEWRLDSAGNGPPTCAKCGKVKSAQGRPKGPPVATVAGVTKQDPPSLPLREALPPANLEPFVPVRR